ncbi:hypothetical protein L6270_03890 [Candidatus Parcubacteria bacterium]|nr:hypothetical protein [Patescibacteria group bacterium]MBU4309105.1 hypothetical protein [Patescibacteria group bacterium]MBU4431951.1 hypothetical protein [Patescibacteria group bacterium]MBU4577466.1 hypothetical protein [Patescibacteria group bacterium]MCG2697154.1 hypothetical protein [Candidatus Parcubacteria bacterium]
MTNEKRKWKPRPHDANTLIAKAHFALNNQRLMELAILCETPSSAQAQAINEGYCIEKIDTWNQRAYKIQKTGTKGAYAVYCLVMLKRNYPEVFWNLSMVMEAKQNLVNQGRIVLSGNSDAIQSGGKS